MKYKIKFKLEHLESNKKIIVGPLGKSAKGEYTIVDSESLEELLDSNDNSDWQEELFTARMTKTLENKPKDFKKIIELLPEVEALINNGEKADLTLFSNSLLSAYFSVFPEQFISFFASYPIREDLFEKIVLILKKRKIPLDPYIKDHQNISIPLLKVLNKYKIKINSFSFYQLELSLIEDEKIDLFWGVFNQEDIKDKLLMKEILSMVSYDRNEKLKKLIEQKIIPFAIIESMVKTKKLSSEYLDFTSR